MQTDVPNFFEWCFRKMPSRLAQYSLCAFLAVISLAACPIRSFAFTTNRIHIMAFEGSDAIILESNGQFGMVDSGEDDDYPDGSDPRYPLRPGTTIGWGTEDEVIEYMRNIGVTSDNFQFYIGTHPHSDHIGSADEVIRAFRPKRVYIPEYKDEYITNDSALWDNRYVYDRMLEAAYEVGATIITELDPAAPIVPSNPVQPFDQGVDYLFNDPRGSHEGPEIKDGLMPQHDPVPNGSTQGAGYQRVDPEVLDGTTLFGAVGSPNFQLGSMTIEIKNYGTDYQVDHVDDANWFSWGVKVDVDGKSAFLGGDIGAYDGDEDRLGAELGHVDVLKLGHLGLGTSNTTSFLSSLSPCYAVQTGDYADLPLNRIELFDLLETRLYCTHSVSKAGNKSVVFSFADDGVTAKAPSGLILEKRMDAPIQTAYQNGRKLTLDGWQLTA